MLIDQIQSDLVSAMKAKNAEKLKALRMLSTAIKNEEIKKRPDKLTEGDVQSIAKQEVKKLNDAISQFKGGGRDDLAKEYAKESDFLKEYLPEEIPEEDVRKVVLEKVASSEDKNFGAIMKAVMSELKGEADGGLVSRLVKEELGK